MNLPSAPATYSQQDQQAMRNAVLRADDENFKKGVDVRLQRSERLIMPSPDGTLWSISVSNAGALVVTAL